MKSFLRNHSPEAALVAFFAAFANLVGASTNLDPSRVQEIAAMLPAKHAGLGQSATNRAAWEKLAFDIRSACAVQELKKLERTFVFHRAAPAR